MRVLSLVFIVIVASTYNTFGQVRNEFFRCLFVDVEGNGGMMTQNVKSIPFSTNYTDALNTTQGKIKFTNGSSVGGDLRLGYYFNRTRSLGFGIGINYAKQKGDLAMDTFHVEFRSTDFQGGTFRQVISTASKIKESITTTTVNIPLLLRYKKSFSEDFFLTVDAGLVYGIQAKNTYNTNAAFNYEAIYKYEGTTPVYDYSAIPGDDDYLITKAFYTAKYPNSDVYQYFKFQDSIGKSVGLNEKAKNTSGNVKYKAGSLGYTAEVAVNFKLVKNVYLRGGAYYTAQSFTNSSTNNSLRLTDQKIRDASGKDLGVNYNSLLNEVQTVNTSNYGLTLGIRVYINRTAWKFPENDMDKITPATGHGL